MKKIWSTVGETAEALAVSESLLWRLKKEGELKAGIHWVYVSGRRTAPVGWNIDEIVKWQIETSQKVEKKFQEDCQKLETYAEMGA
tara:strand:- start:125 stop:382 length:258 start_codon:yes stop_codon:yes gene_type:complete